MVRPIHKEILFVGFGAIMEKYRESRSLNSAKIVSDLCHARKEIFAYEYKNIDFSDFLKIDTVVVSVRLERLQPESKLTFFEMLRNLANVSRDIKFIILSSVAVYGHSEKICDEFSLQQGASIYAQSKIQLENIFIEELKDTNHVILRISNIFGIPGQDDVINNFYKGVVKENCIEVPTSDCFRDFIHVSDFFKILDLFIEGAPNLPRILNVASGQSKSIYELADDICFHLSKSPEDVEIKRILDSAHIDSFVNVALLKEITSFLPSDFDSALIEYLEELKALQLAQKFGVSK
jgi:nucleoside-diphosphate-sugar epimerase